jgi:hypothetical protein
MALNVLYLALAKLALANSHTDVLTGGRELRGFCGPGVLPHGCTGLANV